MFKNVHEWLISFCTFTCNSFTHWKTTVIFAITSTDKVRKQFDIVL